MLNQRASIRRRSAEASDIFLENTSFAVIRQIGSSSSSAQKNCWKVLCAILGGCLLYHIFEMIRGYQEYQSMTATREKHAERDGIPFPSFTFCNMGKFFNRHKKLANGKIHRSAGKADILRAWGMNPRPNMLKKFQKRIQYAWTNDVYPKDNTFMVW